MLPSIVDVAEENGIVIDSNSLRKIEVRAKCPFCLEDSHRPNKYFLSLNVEKNVYKCWYCKQSGGVLDFESRLTGKSFHETREKYFGKNKKKRHYAEYLSPQQLKLIGWNEYKRNSREDFLKRRDDVLQDWKAYCHKEAVKHFALFMVIAHLPDQERQSQLLEYFQVSCKKTSIQSLFTTILKEFTLEEEHLSDWAREGTEIARNAWRVSLNSNDIELKKVVMNVMVLYYLKKMNEEEIQLKNIEKAVM